MGNTLQDTRSYIGYVVNPTLGMVMAGGQGANFYTWDTEVTTDGLSFSWGHRLPASMKGTCSANLNETTIVVTASCCAGERKVYTYTHGNE